MYIVYIVHVEFTMCVLTSQACCVGGMMWRLSGGPRSEFWSSSKKSITALGTHTLESGPYIYVYLLIFYIQIDTRTVYMYKCIYKLSIYTVCILSYFSMQR